MTNIRYPEAFEKPYRRVHVSALTRSKRGGPYYCFGCDQEMVARLGEVNVHHFAHKSQWTTRCDPEHALHRAAQVNILEGFSDAVKKHRPYCAGFPCVGKGCANVVKFNIATSGARIVAEQSAVRGTRADLVVCCPDETGATRVQLIFEVVVTHDLEATTLARYEAANIPVIKIRPCWDSLETLRDAAVGYDTVNIPTPECENCAVKREQREVHERQQELARQTILNKRAIEREQVQRLREQPAHQAIQRKYEKAQEEARNSDTPRPLMPKQSDGRTKIGVWRKNGLNPKKFAMRKGG